MGRKITALKVQKKKIYRINVFLDNEFAFGISRYVGSWLQLGQELTEEKIQELIADDVRETAYQQALRLFKFRDRSEAEIRHYLSKHNIFKETIATVICRLKENGLLDDTRFAKAWVENRTELRPRSLRMLTYELKQKGVSNEDINHAVSGFQEEDLAYNAAKRHALKLKDKDWQKFRQKMYSFLTHRGFNFDAISQATSRVWEECNHDHSSHSYTYKEVDL